MKDNHSEFFQHDLKLPELTLRGIILGAILTVIFTASNVYLGLKVGLTFSSAIPAAVISMAVLRMFKDSNLLENNMVQSQASAAGTLSAIIFVIPGMLMIGYWQHLEFWQTLIVSACGGCLGVLFTIPLRRAMVVHSDLPYPEGVAAAEILKVGSQKNSGGMKEILSGGIISSLVSFATNGFQVLAGGLSVFIPIGKGVSQFALGYSTALIGAGYLIGITSGLALLCGILIAWAGFVPYFTMTEIPADGQTIQEFAQAVYSQRVRLIGAGAMGVAAIWTLITLIKPVVEGVKESLSAVKNSQSQASTHRTDLDMSIKSIGAVFLVTVLGLFGVFFSFVSPANLPTSQTLTIVVVGILVAVLMGFFVAAACAYMAGLIGTSSSPISGIGILAIIVSSLIIFALCSAFGIFGLEGGEKFATATAIFITSIILAIACISNDNMQDLKTGYLVGATPANQQIALIIGCVVGAFVIAPVMNLLYEAYGFVGALPRAGMNPEDALAAPQATLMSTIAQGIFSSSLDWKYIYIGMTLGAIIVLINLFLTKNTKYALPPLAVGMGIYLPPSLQTPLVVGAVMGYFLDKKIKQKFADKSSEVVEENLNAGKRRGTLFASGLIVGESLTGVLIAALIVLSFSTGGDGDPLTLVSESFASSSMPEILGLAVFVAIAAYFCKLVMDFKERD